MTPTEIEERLFDAVAVLREISDQDLHYLACQQLRSHHPAILRTKAEMDYPTATNPRLQTSSGDVDRAYEVIDWSNDYLPWWQRKIFWTYGVTGNWSKTARVFHMSRYKVRRQFIWSLCEISTRLQNLRFQSSLSANA